MDDRTGGEPSSAAKAPGGDQKELGGGRWRSKRAWRWTLEIGKTSLSTGVNESVCNVTDSSPRLCW